MDDQSIKLETCRELDEKFLVSQQEKIRLEIALIRFFDLEKTDEQFIRYLNYLKQRIRPAMEELMRQKEVGKIKRLYECVEVNEGLLEELLLMSMRQQDTECFLWFLEEKRKRFGFSAEDFEL